MLRLPCSGLVAFAVAIATPFLAAVSSGTLPALEQTEAKIVSPRPPILTTDKDPQRLHYTMPPNGITQLFIAVPNANGDDSDRKSFGTLLRETILDHGSTFWGGTVGGVLGFVTAGPTGFALGSATGAVVGAAFGRYLNQKPVWPPRPTVKKP